MITKHQREQLASIVDADVLIEIIQECFTPSEVFSEAQLEEWAENNGFVKES